MVKPLMVTAMVEDTLWPLESRKVAVQVPAATPVTVNVAAGPNGLAVVIVAIVPDAGLHVSCSPKAAV